MRAVNRYLALPALAFAPVFAPSACSSSQVGESATPELKQFQERLGEYVKLRNQGEQTDPPSIAAHRDRLARGIRAARARARQGDIFFPAVQQKIVAILRRELRGPGGEAARAAIRDGNPKFVGRPTPVRVAVNARYPGSAPLSTVPPGLLLKLPPLPEDLEYRFVGHDLILRDVRAGIIVDFISNAAP